MAYLFASPRLRFQSFAKASLSSCTSPISRQNLDSGSPLTLFSSSANLHMSLSSQRFRRTPPGGGREVGGGGAAGVDEEGVGIAVLRWQK